MPVMDRDLDGGAIGFGDQGAGIEQDEIEIRGDGANALDGCLACAKTAEGMDIGWNEKCVTEILRQVAGERVDIVRKPRIVNPTYDRRCCLRNGCTS